MRHFMHEKLDVVFGALALGDIRTLNEDAGDFTFVVLDGLVDEVNEALANRAARERLSRKSCPGRAEWSSGPENSVEQIEVTLLNCVRKDVGDGLAHHIPLSDQFEIGGVCKLDAVLRSFEQRQDGGSLR